MLCSPHSFLFRQHTLDGTKSLQHLLLFDPVLSNPNHLLPHRHMLRHELLRLSIQLFNTPHCTIIPTQGTNTNVLFATSTHDGDVIDMGSLAVTVVFLREALFVSSVEGQLGSSGEDQVADGTATLTVDYDAHVCGLKRGLRGRLLGSEDVGFDADGDLISSSGEKEECSDG